MEPRRILQMESLRDPANAISQGVANGGTPGLANEIAQNPANAITPFLQMKPLRIGLQMKSHRILGPANEIAQNPANVISQRVANGGSPYLLQLSQAVIST